MDIVIRKYKRKDFNQTVNLLKENFNIKEIKEIKNNKNSFNIVAVTNKEVIGYLKVDKLKDIGKNCNYYILNYICVKKDHQNNHIGTKLLEHIFKIANKNNIKYINLTSKPTREIANKLYLKEGFNIKETNFFQKEL